MKKTAFILILSLLLLACANIGYDKQLQQYIGQTEQSLIENFGKPSTQKILPNGDKVLTYVKQGETYMPMEYFYDTPGWGEADVVYNPFFSEYTFMPTSVVVDSEVEGICITSFKIVNNVVKSYHFRGNICD
ncbi:MAG: hypothetical protein IJ830_01230 [Alphaproteobacteria bacterium]|nr:hypothetical protein [Alphaproteobacteria bacterium]